MQCTTTKYVHIDALGTRDISLCSHILLFLMILWEDVVGDLSLELSIPFWFLWLIPAFLVAAVMRSDGFEYLKENCPTLQSELLKTVAGCEEECSSGGGGKSRSVWGQLSDGGDSGGRRVRHRAWLVFSLWMMYCQRQCNNTCKQECLYRSTPAMYTSLQDTKELLYCKVPARPCYLIWNIAFLMSFPCKWKFSCQLLLPQILCFCRFHPVSCWECW